MIDTHTHIYTEEFDADRQDVIARARAAGVRQMLLPNIDADSIAPMLALCDANPHVCFPMIGLHPTDIPDNPQPVLRNMAAWLDTHSQRFAAIGEVGIDLYWDATQADKQIEVLQQQVEWSLHYKLPLVIHSRSAHREVVDTLRPYRNELVGGIFHCFGGTALEAQELLAEFPNFVLGIGGVVTFKKSTLPDVLSECVPLDRIVLETDAPYLAPTPHRGKRNEPSFLPLVAEKIAAIYNTTVDDVASITSQTAQKIFPILQRQDTPL